VANDRSRQPDITGSDPSQASTSTGEAPSQRNSDRAGGGTYFLGRYRVVDEIGIGGMASVHLARMDGPGGFQKWTAIKRIHAHLIEDDSFVQMFLDEARVAARISHPNVATVFELGKAEDSYWIAMEYLHGEPLREVMRRTEEIGAPMPPEIACRVIADAAEGLHAAHELLGKNGEKLQLVHRDVTPHNLFVTYDGNTKVVDFGIAKFSSRMANTRAGTLKGKLAYMSPEQVHGEAIDRRTDIFALGVVLWELTTGQRLFRMESDLDTLAKVQECNVPRPSTLVRGYPIDLEKIVMKALAKNRGERFKTAREFSRALQSLLMRRGLFIAADEVASYVQSIFQDRIQKREAHLRWAAEVTQTINIDRLKAQAGATGEPSLLSFNADAQAPVNPGASVTGGRSLLAPRPNPGPLLAPAERAVPPRAHQPSSAKLDTLHPPSRPAGPLATTAETPSYEEDGPTMQGAGLSSMDDYPPEDEFDDDGDTIVTMTKVDPPVGGRGAGHPMPAAGRPPTLADSGETHAVPGAQVRGGLVSQSGLFGGPSAATSDLLKPPNLADFSDADPMRTPMLVNPLVPQPMAPHEMQQHEQMQQQAMPRPQQPTSRLPSLPRFFRTDADNRTVTARSLRRGPPIWAVAVGSGFVALLIVGVIYAILAQTSSPPATVSQNETGVGTATGTPPTGRGAGTGLAPTTTTTASLASSAATGPFGFMRAGFVTATGTGAATATPGSSVTPPTTAAPTAAIPPATPPAATVAADAPSVPVTQLPTATPPATPPPAAARPPPVATRSDKPPQGLLTVTCKPQICDEVTDNGKPLGTAPFFRKPVPAGEHRIQLKAHNPPITKIVQVFILADDLKVVSVTMAP